MKKITIYADGAARGNPGPGAAAAVIIDEATQQKWMVKEFLGHTTNNNAEYQGVILGLKEAKKRGGQEIKLFLDSELVVKQLKGSYAVKNKNLKILHRKSLNLLANFKKFSLEHISREKNKEVDKLANEAIDDNII